MRHLSKSRAFTLLELMATLTVLALVAGIAAPRLGGVRQRMLAGDAVQRLSLMDQQARDLAIKSGASLELRVDLVDGRLWCDVDGEPAGRPMRLPQSIEIETILSPREDRSSGEAVIRFDRSGASESYAVRLSTNKWLFFAGITGQVSQFDEQRTVERMLQSLESPIGADAD